MAPSTGDFYIEVELPWYSPGTYVLHVELLTSAQESLNQPVAGAPTITGAARVGQTLTSDVSGLQDADGMQNAALSYQWLSDDGNGDQEISGATDASYMLVDGDAGKTVSVRVTFVDDSGNEESATSAGVAVAAASVNAPATGAPAVTGAAEVGGTLTADVSGIADDDGLANATFTYQWTIGLGTGTADIPGATGATYSPTASDEGFAISVRVSFTDDAGHEESLASAATEPVSYAVQQQVVNTPATGAPTVTGAAEVGGTLTADTGGIADQDGTSNAVFSYQWMIGQGAATSDILGATGATYSPTASDEGLNLGVQVSFTDDAGFDETLISPATGAVGPRPNNPATGAPRIRGTAQVGKTLTADTGAISDRDGLANVAYTYQWLAVDAEIDGATQGMYTLVDADDGAVIKVRVSFTDDRGHVEELTSAATALVESDQPTEGAPDAPRNLSVTAVFIGGVDLSWDDVPGAEFYQVQQYRGRRWNDLPGDGVEITFYGAGAIVSGLDPDTTLWFRARAVNGSGASEWSDMIHLNATSQYRLGKRSRPANEPATGAPVIRGAAEAGETLWADTSQIGDGNGLDGSRFEYQWTSDDGNGETDIEGATEPAYVWSEDDDDRSVSVRVSFVDRLGYAESVTSEAVGAVVAQQQIANTPATGAPTITGTAQVGETLTADTSGIADADGLSGAAFAYQWLTNDGTTDTEIAGATGASYTVQASDDGAAIRVWVSFTDDAGNEETLTSAATEPVTFAIQQQIVNTPATGVPTISGTTQVGKTLTASTSGIADADGLNNARFAYRWVANDGASDTDIAGATDSTYTLVDADEGGPIKVRVSFTDDAGHEEALTSAATATVEARPNSPATGQPTILGTARVGETLTASTSGIADTDGLSGVAYSYQWLADGAEITGATAVTYTLTDSEEGRTIQVTVSFTDDADHEEELTSKATGTVVARPNRPATGQPTISGTAEVGETLTADTSGIDDADGLSGVTYGYQWVADDANIAGANTKTYTLTDGEEGKTVQVTVSFTDDAGHAETATSAATGTVEGRPNSPATGALAINGTVQVGETLTADTSGISDSDGLTNASYSYQWLADGTAMAGATDSTYTLTDAEEGKTVQVAVSFTDDAGNDETATSAATNAVEARPNSPATGLPTISGAARVGETLTADTSAIADQDGLTNVSYGYQWLADGVDIAGATDSTYTLTDSEVGKAVQVAVSFTDNAGNEESLTSAATGTVEARPNSPVTGQPAISGTAQVGETLTADTSAIADQDGLSNVSYGYQWIAGGTDLSGATGSTYTLTSAEVGKTVQVSVSFTDDAGNDESLTSAATAAVAALERPGKPGD